MVAVLYLFFSGINYCTTMGGERDNSNKKKRDAAPKKRWSLRVAAREKEPQYAEVEEGGHTAYKKKIKSLEELGGQALVKDFRRNEALRSHLYRKNLSQEKKMSSDSASEISRANKGKGRNKKKKNKN